MAVFTLEDEQIVWTVKSSQMDIVWFFGKLDEQIFRRLNSSEFVRLFVRLWSRVFEDDLFVQTNKSTEVRPNFTLRRT